MDKPKVIFLDVVETILAVKGSVGQIYSDFARKVGVTVDPEAVQNAFNESFIDSRSPIFPGVDAEQIPEKEFQWWRDIVKNTFTLLNCQDQFEDFDGFFTVVYSHFATPDPWMVYPDVVPALKLWKSIGIELGIISNFDSRLYAVLELLNLTPYFSSITISSTVGAAKPDTKIFTTALQKHNCLPGEAWHIGNHLKEDYFGAKTSGIIPFLINRDGKYSF